MSKRRRVTVSEAAEILGISEGAVRMPIRRGTLRSEKTDDRVYVWLHEDLHADQNDVQHGVRDDPLVEELRERVASLERQLDTRTEELREHRRLLAAALERIPPQLEASQSAEEGQEGPEPRSGTPGSQEGAEAPQPRRRSWWREFFGIGG